MIYCIIIFILIILVFIYLFFKLYYTKIKDNVLYWKYSYNLDCKWKPVKQIKNISEDVKYSCETIIDIINKLNLTYFIGFGSELQAYRDGFLKSDDHDIDIMVPIWLNKHIFGCGEYKPINRKKFNTKNLKINDKYKLCNKNFTEHHITLTEYLKNLKLKGIRAFYRYYGNTQIHFQGKIRKYYLDVWPFISNEYGYEDISICKCQFCGKSVYCTENPLNSIVINYGNDWMIPKRCESLLPKFIDSLDS